MGLIQELQKNTCMKKLMIGFFILISSLIVSKANAQAYVGVKFGWAPPVPVVVAPRVYAPAMPYYRPVVPIAPYRAYFPEYYHERCRRHHGRW